MYIAGDSNGWRDIRICPRRICLSIRLFLPLLSSISICMLTPLRGMSRGNSGLDIIKRIDLRETSPSVSPSRPVVFSNLKQDNATTILAAVS